MWKELGMLFARIEEVPWLQLRKVAGCTRSTTIHAFSHLSVVPQIRLTASQHIASRPFRDIQTLCDIEGNSKLLRCTTLSHAASPPQYCRSTAFLTSSPRKTNSRRRTCSTKFDSAVLLVVLVVIVEAGSEAGAVSTSAAAPPL